MWIMTRYGFFSVVENRENKNAVLIRARAKADLERLCDRYGDTLPGFKAEDIDGPDRYADYRWRLWVQRSDWMKALVDLTEDIDYDNFKDAVKKVDSDRANRYMSVWGVLLRVQDAERDADGKPYTKAWDDTDWWDAPHQEHLPLLTEEEAELTDEELYEQFIDGSGTPESDGRID